MGKTFSCLCFVSIFSWFIFGVLTVRIHSTIRFIYIRRYAQAHLSTIGYTYLALQHEKPFHNIYFRIKPEWVLYSLDMIKKCILSYVLKSFEFLLKHKPFLKVTKFYSGLDKSGNRRSKKSTQDNNFYLCPHLPSYNIQFTRYTH